MRRFPGSSVATVMVHVNWNEKTIACVCVCLRMNAFCWANCNLSFLREINDVFQNQNENWYFWIYSPFFLSNFSDVFFILVLWESSQSHFATELYIILYTFVQVCECMCVRVCLNVLVSFYIQTVHTMHYAHVSNTPCELNFSQAFIFDTYFFPPSLSLRSHIQFRFVYFRILNFTVVLLPLACCFHINDFGMVTMVPYRWLACFKTIFRSIKCLYFL